MKLLLVYPNTYRYLAPPPVGLSMVAKVARDAGHEVASLDLMWERDPLKTLKRALEAEQPELVGFSLRNIDDQNYGDCRFFIPEYGEMVALANRVAPTVIGGSALMAMPEAVYRATGATYGLCGEGVYSFVHFLEEFSSGASKFKTPGVIWEEGGSIHINPWGLKGYSDRGAIDWSVIDYKAYRRSEMPSAIITKSGCTHRCLFCDTERSFGGCFVPRPVEQIVGDLKREAREYRLNRFTYMFIDACFNQPVEWAKALCEAIIHSQLKIGYMVIIEPTADLDAELVTLMKRSGCTMVTMLLGSAEESMLRTMRRPYRMEDIRRANALFEAARIPVMPQLLLGGPGENRKTIEANFDFLSTIKPLYVDLSYGIRVMPGAGIYQQALDEGVITDAHNLLHPTFYLSPEVDQKWLDRKIKRYRWSKLPHLGGWASTIKNSLALRFQ